MGKSSAGSSFFSRWQGRESAHHITARCHVTLPTFKRKARLKVHFTFLGCFAAFAKLSCSERNSRLLSCRGMIKSLADYNAGIRRETVVDAYISDNSCLLLPFIPHILRGARRICQAKVYGQTVARCELAARTSLRARTECQARQAKPSRRRWIDGARNGLGIFAGVTQNPRKRYGGVCHVVYFPPARRALRLASHCLRCR